METGYDIIFFWVARMMMLGLELTDGEPFHTVYLSGLIRDPIGQKMSKTKGNVVDPLGVIDESGADALRFALIHGATPGNDQRFGPAKLEHARNFANKLWNATRFVLGARPGVDRRRTPSGGLPDARHLGPAERWLRSRAAATTAAVDRRDGRLRVRRGDPDPVRRRSGASSATGASSSPRSGSPTRTSTGRPARRPGGRSSRSLDTYLRLLHPVMPFVTEALWAALPHRRQRPGAAHRRPLARGRGARRDRRGARSVRSIDLVTEIRNARASAKLPAADWLETLVFVPLGLGLDASRRSGRRSSGWPARVRCAAS